MCPCICVFTVFHNVCVCVVHGSLRFPQIAGAIVSLKSMPFRSREAFVHCLAHCINHKLQNEDVDRERVFVVPSRI